LANHAQFHSTALNKIAGALCESLHVKIPSVQKKAGELSGGNQQKVLLARWLNCNPDILILDEPTQGIDIGAKFEIYRLIRQLAGKGKGILLISSEMNELLNLCNRIMVIKDGRCLAILESEEASEEKILSMVMEQDGPTF
jgi:ABC-type sugar transport system ATPase subunit